MNRTNTLLLIVALAAIPAAAYFVYTNAQRGSIACTQEAKLCQDGSYVGRSGPTCEFAACPTVQHRPDWIATSTAELSFEYPRSVGTQGYLDASEWPPTISLSSGTLSCENAASPGVTRSVKTISGHMYCIEMRDDAAAGSRYTTYAYTFSRDAGVVTLRYTIRAVQCANYDEPKQTECRQTQSDFDPDVLTDTMASTIRFLTQPPVVPSI